MWCQVIDGECVEWIIYHLERASLSTGIIRKTALWTETLISKLSSFLEVGASDVERPLEVCTWKILRSKQEEMNLSFCGFPSLHEKISSTDASLTWTRLHIVLLRGGRLGLRFKPSCEPSGSKLPHVVLGLGCSHRVRQGEMDQLHIRGKPSWKDCLVFNSFRFWGAGLLPQAPGWLLQNLLLFPVSWVKGWIHLE